MVTSEVPATELGGRPVRCRCEDVYRPGPVFQDFHFFKSGDGPVPQSFSCYPLDVPADRPAADIAKLTEKKSVILKGIFLRRRLHMMDFSNSKDERLLAFYDNVRRQVELDMRSGGRYRFAGDSVKLYADKLREEMERRRLRFTPIDWHR